MDRPGHGHVSTPAIGATEFEAEETERDAAGRISKRVVASRVYRYQYDALGRLRFYFDEEDLRDNAECEYDFLGRRIQIGRAHPCNREWNATQEQAYGRRGWRG